MLQSRTWHLVHKAWDLLGMCWCLALGCLLGLMSVQVLDLAPGHQHLWWHTARWGPTEMQALPCHDRHHAPPP